MMFAEALYLDFANQMAPATRDFFRWITFLVSTPVVFYSGWPFISGMVRELGQRRLEFEAQRRRRCEGFESSHCQTFQMHALNSVKAPAGTR